MTTYNTTPIPFYHWYLYAAEEWNSESDVIIAVVVMLFIAASIDIINVAIFMITGGL